MERETERSDGIRGSCLSRIQGLGRKNMGTARIADFILANPEAAVELTIYELAEAIGMSVATISRFCARLGYENYRAFQLDLMASLAHSLTGVSDDFRAGDEPETVVQRVFEMNRQSLVDTESVLDRKALIEVATHILKAKRVFLIGVGGSGLVCRIGVLRFESLGIGAAAINDPYEGLFALGPSGSQDVVIALSHTGRSSAVTKLIDYVKDRGAVTVAVTNYSDSPLAALCQYTLLTSFRERRVNAAVSSSRAAQVCVLDALYFLVGYYQSTRTERLAQQIEAAAERLLRDKP